MVGFSGSPKQQRVRTLIAVAVVVFACVTLSFAHGFFTTLQNQITDAFFLPEAPGTDIVIIDIDEESISELGQWPFDRRVHAALLGQLNGARIIGFDIILSEPSRSGTEDDSALREAIIARDIPVVIPTVRTEGALIEPLALFAPHVRTGFVNITPERDGTVRFIETTHGDLLSFDRVLSEKGNKEDLHSSLVRIAYRGPARTYPTLSYVDVLNGLIPEAAFNDKIVLVGASAAGLGDTFQTPYGAMAGVEIHANVIDMLLQEDFFTEVPFYAGVLLLALVVLLTTLAILFVQRTEFLVGTLALIALTIFIGAVFLFGSGIIIPHLYLLLLFVATAALLLLVQYLFESKEKQFIRRGFEQYVAPEVVRELSHAPEKLVLGGETRTLTILFSDIRGFTTISESLTPEALMAQLNEYLSGMSDAVMDTKGMVDKYIGDAVMAFWGAPLADDAQALHACESVIKMFTALDALNAAWKANGKPVFQIGVGISTGEVVVGNMGSSRRFNYSIIGDEVNFSARLEGLTKAYGAKCILGERTYLAIKDEPHLYTRELDEVMVKGKYESKKIYELLITAPDVNMQKALEHFKEGRAHYKRGEWDAAVAAFREAVKQGDTGPAQVFLERSEKLKVNPPKDWTGVYTFTEK